MGVPPQAGSGCQPTASAAEEASSRSGIPNAAIYDHWRTLTIGAHVAGDDWAVRYLNEHFTLKTPDAIPRDICEQVLSMGRAEWGMTDRFTEVGHLAHLRKSLRITREHFNFEDVPVPMHGLYLAGTETVLCHTGTSPNSGPNAQALAGAWNWLFDQCAASGTDARKRQDAEERLDPKGDGPTGKAGDAPEASA